MNMEDVVPTAHFREVMEMKGFTDEQIFSALTSPDKVTAVRRYPGQERYCGAGVAVIVQPAESEFILITAYADGIVTPLREDQLNDPAALNSRRLA